MVYKIILNNLLFSYFNNHLNYYLKITEHIPNIIFTLTVMYTPKIYAIYNKENSFKKRSYLTYIMLEKAEFKFGLYNHI